MQSIGRDPIFIERAEGAEIVDVDGNRYVDWVMSWGPLIHGHAHPAILEAIAAAAAQRDDVRRADRRRGRPRRGDHPPHPVGRDGADDVERHRGVDERDPPRARRDRPREAPEVRRRLPRPRRRPARRGRLGPRDGRASRRQPGRARRPRRSNTIIVPWNDPEAVARACAEHEFAAILAEPYPANMGLVPPVDSFLEVLRDAGDRQRRAARLRRGHHRLPARRRAAPRSSSASTRT